MRKLYLVCVAALCGLTGISQIPISSLNTPYTQDFNTLAITGSTNTNLPQGWFLTETGQSGNTSYRADNGSSNTGDTYSYGATNATERAFGTLRSGNTIPLIGASFVNTTPTTITSLQVAYTGEMWRLGVAGGRTDQLTFEYTIGGTTFTAPALNFITPSTATPAGLKNGNDPANQTNLSYTITGLSIAPNAAFSIRWVDEDIAGAEDGLAIDNFSITASGTIQPPCSAPTAQPGAPGFSNVTTSSFDVSFAAASPAPDQYLAIISTAATLSATPVDGTVYNTDDAIGNGTVAYQGAGTSFSETNLTPGTTYYLYLFAVNSNCNGGPVYRTTAPATGAQATTTPPVCTAPTSQPGSIVFSTISGNSISGSFTAATDADGYLVVVSTNSSLNFTPANGTTYAAGTAAGNGTVIKYGAGTTFSATGLATNTTYYFSFFAFNGINCVSGPVYRTTAVTANATTNSNTSGIPTGYYDAVTPSLSCASLKTILKTRTTNGHSAQSYGALWTQYTISDIKPREVFYAAPNNTPNVIWDIYSDNPTGTDPYNFTPVTGSGGLRQSCSSFSYSNESDCYNREHSVPLNWFNGNTNTPGAATDYHHIFPTDGKVNAVRSNLIYGIVSNATETSLNGSKMGPNAYAGLSGNAFEPIDTYKGDVARAFLYFVTRYEDQMASTNTNSPGAQAFEQNTYPSVDNAYLNLMIQWHTQDPVSQKEIDRNNAAYDFQGNRNPYIDHPEYVDRVWNNGCSGVILPVQLLSFKGSLLANKVVLDWKVQQESNLLQYEIERSENGRRFTGIGTVKATGLAAYRYADDISNLTGRRLYYRLKKVDTDGKFTYSDVFTVHIPANLSFSVYPNPVNNGLIHVQLAQPAAARSFLQLTDAAGKIHQQVAVTTGATSFTLPVQRLAPGIYLLRLTQPSGNAVVQKIQVL